MNIIIREIEVQDYADVVSICNNELNCNNTIEDAIIHYERVKDDERYKTFVALDNDKLVGFVSSVYSFEIGRKVGFMHITGLAVNKDNQHRGVGKCLLKFMENYAKEKEITSIVLNSGIQRIAAHGFYEHNGYNKGSWCFSKKI